MLGKIEGRRRSGQQRMRWLDGITNSVNMNLSKLLEMVEDGAWRVQLTRLQTVKRLNTGSSPFLNQVVCTYIIVRVPFKF